MQYSRTNRRLKVCIVEQRFQESAPNGSATPTAAVSLSMSRPMATSGKYDDVPYPLRPDRRRRTFCLWISTCTCAPVGPCRRVSLDRTRPSDRGRRRHARRLLLAHLSTARQVQQPTFRASHEDDVNVY